MAVEGDGERLSDQTRIRRLQQILGIKRASPVCTGTPEGIIGNSDPSDTRKLNVAIQNALSDLKSEAYKVKANVENLMEEVHALKQSNKRLETETKDRGLEMERRFTAQMEEFMQSVRFELACLKREDNPKRPSVSRNLPQRKGSQMTILSDHYNGGEVLRKDALLNTSPQYIERTVAAVRGWLRESPTPRDSTKGVEQRHDDHLIHVPTSLLMSCIKNEAKLYSKHHKKASNNSSTDLTPLKRSESGQFDCSGSETRVSSIASDGTPHAPPAMRILHSRNVRMADFLASESDED